MTVSVRAAAETDLPAVLAIYNDAVAKTTAIWNDGFAEVSVRMPGKDLDGFRLFRTLKGLRRRPQPQPYPKPLSQRTFRELEMWRRPGAVSSNVMMAGYQRESSRGTSIGDHTYTLL